MNILLVDDDADIRNLTAELIVSWGYSCDTAANGDEAIYLAQHNIGKYDICLMDINMPGIDGYTATRIIRHTTDYFPIIAVTADIGIEQLCKQSGMDGYLEKPYRIEELHKLINEFTA